MDTHAKSIAKAISWRLLATFITAMVVWKISGKSELGLSVGIIDSLFKLVVYYGHERFWNSLASGLSERNTRQALSD